MKYFVGYKKCDTCHNCTPQREYIEIKAHCMACGKPADMNMGDFEFLCDKHWKEFREEGHEYCSGKNGGWIKQREQRKHYIIHFLMKEKVSKLPPNHHV